MLSHIVLRPSLFAALGIVVLPAVVMAQTPAAQAPIVHPSIYTPRSASELAAGMQAPRTNMPRVSPTLMPMAVMQSHNTLPSGAYALLPGVSPGSSDGVHRTASANKGVVSDAYGNYSPQSIAPYTTARASATVLGPTPTAAAVGVTSYLMRATGKLYFYEGPDLFVCSGSLIGPGLVVTAAHCVFTYGTNSAAGFHTNFAFVPAQNTAGATPPYGAWASTAEIIAPTYYNGTDSCSTRGIVCSNDIAVMILAPDANGHLPGSLLGYYGYAWDGYSFTSSFGNASLASITQLGYPVAFDTGSMLERTDGIGSYWSPDGATMQTLLGSAMTAGSSGGPWLVNFGAVPTISNSASLGTASAPQTVVGVTSWGFDTVGHNTQGASWFGQNIQFPNPSYPDSHGVDRGAGNIGALVAAACSASFTSC